MHESLKSGALTETSFLILLSVFTPNQGYGIMQFIEAETQGRVTLGPGTLYGAINMLLGRGWISPYGSTDGRKKEYLITRSGKDTVLSEFVRLQSLCRLAQNVVKGETGIGRQEDSLFPESD